MTVRHYTDETDLEDAKLGWACRLRSIHPERVLDWIIGVEQPPASALAEVAEQRHAMLDHLLAACRAIGAIKLPAPPSGPYDADQAWVLPPLRNFPSQLSIWNRKYAFKGPAFDRISEHARNVCGPLLRPDDEQWQPALPRHRSCWGVAPWPEGAEGGRSLTADERQVEILTASAAPGISRHHWGTDADLFSVELAPWSDPAGLRGVHSWLAGGDGMHPHAAGFGFVQPFTADSGGYGPPYSARRGHMAEPWHWSYLPIAQALLEFSLAHQELLEAKLDALWQGQQFSYIRRHWRDYLCHVNTAAWF